MNLVDSVALGSSLLACRQIRPIWECVHWWGSRSDVYYGKSIVQWQVGWRWGKTSGRRVVVQLRDDESPNLKQGAFWDLGHSIGMLVTSLGWDMAEKEGDRVLWEDSPQCLTWALTLAWGGRWGPRKSPCLSYLLNWWPCSVVGVEGVAHLSQMKRSDFNWIWVSEGLRMEVICM